MHETSCVNNHVPSKAKHESNSEILIQNLSFCKLPTAAPQKFIKNIEKSNKEQSSELIQDLFIVHNSSSKQKVYNTRKKEKVCCCAKNNLNKREHR